MASLVTQMIIAEKYGLRLNTAQLADAMGIKEGTVRNRISARTFPIATYEENGRRWADYRDVASYFDAMAEKAREAA